MRNVTAKINVFQFVTDYKMRFPGVPVLPESMRHHIYDQILNFLADRKLRSLATGVVIPYVLHPCTKQALLSDGWTHLEIAQTESAILDDLEEHPCWSIERDVPDALFDELLKTNKAQMIFDNRIVPIPDRASNVLICRKLQPMFSQSAILSCPGFILEGSDIRLDVAEYGTGFVMPIVRHGLIANLRIFRNPGDQRPFVLKSRGGEVALNA